MSEIIIREIEENDLEKGFLESLDFLRNIITKNIELNNLIGKKLTIGKTELEGIDLCRPCKNLQETLGHDNIIKEFLRKGGLRCKILVSGKIKLGDQIKL